MTYKQYIDSDYTVKDGRLINNAPPCETGIAKMAKISKSLKRANEVSKIAEGIELAEMKKITFNI